MNKIFATRARPFALNPLALAVRSPLPFAAGSAHADQAADMQAKLDALQKQVEERNRK